MILNSVSHKSQGKTSARLKESVLKIMGLQLGMQVFPRSSFVPPVDHPHYVEWKRSTEKKNELEGPMGGAASAVAPVNISSSPVDCAIKQAIDLDFPVWVKEHVSKIGQEVIDEVLTKIDLALAKAKSLKEENDKNDLKRKRDSD